MKILVTGHQGFIGRNMTSFLSKQPDWQVDGYEWDPKSVLMLSSTIGLSI